MRDKNAKVFKTRVKGILYKIKNYFSAGVVVFSLCKIYSSYL